MSRTLRTLTAKRDFDRVFRVGVRGGSETVRVVAAYSRDPEGHVAFVASKRIGNAVVRNRSKRVLRAVARDVGFSVAGFDVVLLATPKTATASHGEIMGDLKRVAARIQKRLSDQENSSRSRKQPFRRSSRQKKLTL